MTTKTIKGIDEKTWTEFRAMAIKSKMKTGELFKRMVESHKREEDAVWDKILNFDAKLTPKERKEWDEWSKEVARQRKEDYGFRT